MNKIILLFVLTTFCSTVSAQNYTVTPNPAYGVADTDDVNTEPDDVVAYAHITNNTSDTIYMRWERIVNEKPECWETAVCDVDLCYYFTINTVDFKLPPNLVDGEMLVHAYPGGEPGASPTIGEAEVVVKLSDLNNPADSLILEYYFTVTGSAICITSVSEVERESLKIYPNPASDNFSLTETQEIQQLVVYNILGHQVRTFEVNGGETYNISDLPNGVYLVGMIDRDFEIVKTVKLQKF